MDAMMKCEMKELNKIKAEWSMSDIMFTVFSTKIILNHITTE
jgi:hypothetical protein